MTTSLQTPSPSEQPDILIEDAAIHFSNPEDRKVHDAPHDSLSVSSNTEEDSPSSETSPPSAAFHHDTPLHERVGPWIQQHRKWFIVFFLIVAILFGMGYKLWDAILAPSAPAETANWKTLQWIEKTTAALNQLNQEEIRMTEQYLRGSSSTFSLNATLPDHIREKKRWLDDTPEDTSTPLVNVINRTRSRIESGLFFSEELKRLIQSTENTSELSQTLRDFSVLDQALRNQQIESYKQTLTDLQIPFTEDTAKQKIQYHLQKRLSHQ